MYDVNSGDKTSKVSAPAGAFLVFALLSLFVMMWWGYGGYATLAPAELQSLFAQILIYLCVAFAAVHGVFFSATRATRRGALYGFLSPWAIVILIAVPQFLHSPGEVLLILLIPMLVFAVDMVAEQILHNDK